ncbi:MAG: heme ABC transporter ATP-binding protein [Anaerolineaceae bacterium]|nr:heme ABC transporter ATP-binding protein [Anaerolineaceae bacterium]
MVQTNTLPSGHTRIDSAELRGVSKRFPGVLANDQVNFDVQAGEIHALLGENGAGKSTLMKILYGLYQPDEGEIRLNGETVQFHSPADALTQGIGMIHQHFMLVPTLTVTENVALGMKSGPLLDLKQVRKRLVELAEAYGLKIDPDAYVWQLSVGEQQRVEIVKALYRGGALIILDEPTAVLTPQEVSELFVILQQMRDQGHALIFISHKLYEVQELCGRITVMRDGHVVDTIHNDGVDQRTLARMMVGRDVKLQPDRPEVEAGTVKLEIRSLSVRNDRDLLALDQVSLNLHGGEILGIAGVSGNGQRELAECIAGLRSASDGEVLLAGQPLLAMPVQDRLQAGLAFIPEERNRHGTIGNFSVAENAILQTNSASQYLNGVFYNFDSIRRYTYDLIQRFNIKTPSHDTAIKNLSGGNVQKLILARELSRQPVVLIAAQPTRGVDIGASEYIRSVLMQQRSSGVAILLISEDLDEILALSDRIAVLYEGRVVDIVDRENADVEMLGLMMAGVTSA